MQRPFTKAIVDILITRSLAIVCVLCCSFGCASATERPKEPMAFVHITFVSEPSGAEIWAKKNGEFVPIGRTPYTMQVGYAKWVDLWNGWSGPGQLMIYSSLYPPAGLECFEADYLGNWQAVYRLRLAGWPDQEIRTFVWHAGNLEKPLDHPVAMRLQTEIEIAARIAARERAHAPQQYVQGQQSGVGNDRAEAEAEYNAALKAYGEALAEYNTAKARSDLLGLPRPRNVMEWFSQAATADATRQAQAKLDIAQQRLEAAKERVGR